MGANALLLEDRLALEAAQARVSALINKVWEAGGQFVTAASAIPNRLFQLQACGGIRERNS